MHRLLFVIAAIFTLFAGGPADAQTITQRAASEHEAKCRSGDATACWVVGRWYKGGIRMPQDRPRAAALLRRSCELGNADGCKELADLQLTPGGAGYDPAAGVTYFDARCRGGDAAECWRLAKAYLAGQPGIARDPVKGRGFAERACNGGWIDGCRTSAGMAARGEGGPADAARALQFAEKGCTLRNVEMCNMAISMAVTRLAPPDGMRAAKAAESSCALKDARGCVLLAQLHSDGKFLPVDRPKAKDAAIKACERKSVEGCRAFLALAESKPEIAVAHNRLCALKQIDGCLEFGRMAEEGDGIALDNLRAMMAYRSALRIDPDHAEAKRRYDIVSKKPVG